MKFYRFIEAFLLKKDNKLKKFVVALKFLFTFKDPSAFYISLIYKTLF